MAYLIDADVFIRAKNLHYGMDFCPAFWDWLVAEALGLPFFLRPDATVLPALAKVSEWATSQNYEPSAVNTFLQVADYYLVAQALAGGFTVVTHEVPSASMRKIKIPDACIGLGIKCMSPYEMLRRERARFILGRGVA